MILKMKRSKLLLTSSVMFIVLTLYVKYSCSRSYKEIHHLLTDDEREEIFGHPFAEYVPEYDVLHPVQVDARGRFLSRDLANGNARRKRDIGSAGGFKEPVFFKLSAFGQDFHLNVTINDELFSPNFEIEIRSNGSSEFHYEIDHCHYIGQLLPAEGNGNKVAVSNCDGLKGLIRTPQDAFVVHPLPDRLKLGKNNTRAHVIHRRSLSRTHAQSLEKALEKEKRSDSWCGVEGGSAIQQSDESESHLNFARSSANQKRTIESMIVVEKMMTRFYGVDQIKKYVPTIVNMAHGILADASIGANIKYMIHKLLILQQDMRGLVISAHAASTLTSFCKWTTGENEQDDKNPLHFDHAALISKYNFCRDKNARAEDCGTILGLADLKGMCKQDTSCTLNKDTGLGTAFTLAHETAHNLGAEHDGESNKCNDGVYIMATRASGKLTAFDWSPCSRNYVTKFLQTKQSGCLNDDAKNTVDIPKGLPGQLYDGNDQCVRMFGAGSRVCDIPDLKEKMCVNLHCEKPDGYCSSNDEPAADGTKCGDKKWCRRGRCVPVGTKGFQDVDGNWGAWKPWSSCYPRCGKGLSVRVRECDNPSPKGRGKLCEGKGTEYKLCNNAKCLSNPRMKQCKDKRDVQFEGGVTYNWIYDPYYSSGKAECVLNCATTEGDTTTFGNVKDGTPCTDKPNSGVCINGQCETVGCDGMISSRAKTDRCGVCNGDGSSCSGGGSQGNRPTPGKEPKPGKKPEPNKPLTTSGKLEKFTYDKRPGYGEYDVVIGTIPAGARNIKIEEGTASDNNLFLEDADYNYIIDYDTYRADFGPEEFKGAGTTFLFKKQNQKETITAPGPLKKSVTLSYEVYDYWNKYKVNYQYVKPGTQSTRGLSIDSDFPDLLREIYKANKDLREAEEQSEDEEKPKMKWMMSSQGCSVTCGGGIEVITPVCVREDDQSAVGDQFCEEKRPEDVTKECNTQTCPSRWEIGEWTECTKSCNDGENGVRSREVFCVEDSQGVELEVKDSKCKEPKPISQEACGKQPCPAEWYTERVGQCSTSCGPGVQRLTVECIRINSAGETKTVDEQECMDIKPPTQVACNVENPCNDQLEVEE